MRQLKRSRLKTYYIKQKTVTLSGSEGVPEESFGEAFSVRGEVWPATSRRQIEEYGDRISNISNVRLSGDIEVKLIGGVPTAVQSQGQAIRPGDGFFVLADTDSEPDYQVLSITPYKPVLMEIERRT